MKETIGKTAGKIWRALSQKEEISISQLPKIVKEKAVIVYKALGWLAREDKIEYHSRGRRISVSLTGAERDK
jgi:hypothetical protein